MIDLIKIWTHEGIFHIIDPNALDHLLYIIALALPFILSKPKELLIQVSAFTIGHTLSLAFSATSTLILDKFYIECGILTSVLVTAILGMRYKDRSLSVLHYLITLFVGCIHGFGFGSEFATMHQDKGREFVSSLFGFNLGVEIGQLVIIAMTFICIWGLTKVGHKYQRLLYLINGAIAIYASILLYRLIVT